MYRNTQTSRLYEPLQTTLDKSMVRNPALQLNKSRAYERIGATSRISRKMRSLSPQEANYIRSSTIIPVGKDLVPTDHLWKVRGKQFSAVNIQVKEGPPVPASHIRINPGMRGGVITTETVYEFMPKQPEYINNTRSITNLRTILPQKAPPVLAPSRISTFRPPTSSVQVRKVATPIRISQAPSIPPISQYHFQPAQPTNTSIVDHNTMVSTLAPPKVEYTDYRTSNGLNYNLKPEMAPPKKQKYKYNFFSALDEAVNTKCGSCGANEIIASKPLSSWE